MVSIAAHTALTFYTEYHWWWKGEARPFGVQYEGFWNDYSYGVDKFGHFYTSYAEFLFGYEFMRWSGFDEDASIATAAGLTVFHAVTVELADGFRRYRFSPDDLLFNSMGLMYGYLQIKEPFFRNFTFKWSYFPVYPAPFGGPFYITEDYDGHLYWLTADVHQLLPERFNGYWPSFLNLAVGYGAVNASKGANGPLMRKFVIGLDYNLKALPISGDIWDLFKGVLDRFHYPAPGVKMGPERRTTVHPFILN
ncbi:MAG: DUF2279 domain-containing protein [Bacteroidetes bacterium]|nr:DUF2279 domain-containing protein [Bacteroidota bacterium]